MHLNLRFNVNDFDLGENQNVGFTWVASHATMRVSDVAVAIAERFGIAVPWQDLLLTSSDYCIFPMNESALIFMDGDVIIISRVHVPVPIPLAVSSALGTDRRLKDCTFCGLDAITSMCAGCRRARYCSVGCQREHWSLHKRTCFPAQPRRLDNDAM